jgi:hypothetical protein
VIQSQVARKANVWGGSTGLSSIGRKRKRGKVKPIQVIAEIKDIRESGACGQRFVPVSIYILSAEKPLNSALNGMRIGMTSSHKTE